MTNRFQSILLVVTSVALSMLGTSYYHRKAVEAARHEQDMTNAVRIFGAVRNREIQKLNLHQAKRALKETTTPEAKRLAELQVASSYRAFLQALTEEQESWDLPLSDDMRDRIHQFDEGFLRMMADAADRDSGQTPAQQAASRAVLDTAFTIQFGAEPHGGRR